MISHDVLQKNEGDRTLAKGEERKERWLEFHDRNTGGIPCHYDLQMHVENPFEKVTKLDRNFYQIDAKSIK